MLCADYRARPEPRSKSPTLPMPFLTPAEQSQGKCWSMEMVNQGKAYIAEKCNINRGYRHELISVRQGFWFCLVLFVAVFSIVRVNFFLNETLRFIPALINLSNIFLLALA